jgi:hypothetical protein
MQIKNKQDFWSARLPTPLPSHSTLSTLPSLSLTHPSPSRLTSRPGLTWRALLLLVSRSCRW